MTAPLHVIVLAAGQGTRMRSALPKVLHPLGGRPLIAHVLETAASLGAAGIHIVHGHGGERVRDWVGSRFPDAPLSWAQQAQQLGTAHAVMQAMPAIPDAAQVLVMYGDVPLTPVDTLRRLVDAGRETLAVLTVMLDDPSGYGRILRDAQGQLRGIVEDKDADAAQRAVREVNTGMISAPADALRGWLARIGNANAKGEFYLTDAVALAVQDGFQVDSISAGCVADVEGVNDRVQLAHLERVLQRRRADALLREGVTLADPARIDVRGSLRCGRDVQIDVGCIFEGDVVLDDGVRIGPYCVLEDVTLGPDTVVESHSVLSGVRAGAQTHVGPFARLRPGTQLADHARVGNFVEIKQSTLGEGSKVNHLSYVGDATVGAQVNIGAGTITCNYDGANKHRTTIGDNAFIGSNTALVAPVTVGVNATIAAGSVIARDAPAGGLTIARAREQKTVPGWKRPAKKT